MAARFRLVNYDHVPRWLEWAAAAVAEILIHFFWGIGWVKVIYTVSHVYKIQLLMMMMMMMMMLMLMLMMLYIVLLKWDSTYPT